MSNQLTSNADALRLFFTEDVYLVKTEPKLHEAPQPLEQQGHQKSTETQSGASFPISPSSPKSSPPLIKKTWAFEYLGKNLKGILILVNDQENKVSSAQGTELLRKLVKAIELTNNDFALINYAHYMGATFEDLYQFFDCKLVLAFGVDASSLALTPQPLHQSYDFGQTKIIFTSNLTELDADQAGKKMLWTTLQAINK